MRGGGRGYIGVVVDHDEFSNSMEDYDIEEGEGEGEDNCPACARAGFGSKLSRKIIFVIETKRGPRISKHPIIDLGLDPHKEQRNRQCRECGNIYDLEDLPTANRRRVEGGY